MKTKLIAFDFKKTEIDLKRFLDSIFDEIDVIELTDPPDKKETLDQIAARIRTLGLPIAKPFISRAIKQGNIRRDIFKHLNTTWRDLKILFHDLPIITFDQDEKIYSDTEREFQKCIMAFVRKVRTDLKQQEFADLCKRFIYDLIETMKSEYGIEIKKITISTRFSKSECYHLSLKTAREGSGMKFEAEILFSPFVLARYAHICYFGDRNNIKTALARLLKHPTKTVTEDKFKMEVDGEKWPKTRSLNALIKEAPIK